ncbi:MAG: dephospho-CoA kinase [Chitinophagaceae bacterium]
MLRLGVTGGIGSGKSTVCQIFESLDVPVYNADARAKFLVGNDQALQAELISAFGDQTFINGEYNRTYIAGIVFADKFQLEKLNGIIHPHVLADWDVFCHKFSHLPYVVKEAAIMLETDSKKSIDKVALVYAPLSLRIERVMKRDGVEKSSVEARIAAQMSEEEKLKLADFVIFNDPEHSLIEQVLHLHHLLIKQAD